MSEVYAIGLGAVLMIGAGVWLTIAKTRAWCWYMLAALCESNGDACIERAKKRQALVAAARMKAVVTG